jgi:hypothetical protein
MTTTPVRKDQVFGIINGDTVLDVRINALNTLILRFGTQTRRRTSGNWVPGVRVAAKDVSAIISDAPIGYRDLGGPVWKEAWAVFEKAGWQWEYEEGTPGVGNPDTFLFW